jgi:prepilin-type N-terminal cleavage/methylation domain-containing protein
MRTRTEPGFTLIELLIVIAMIGILVALVGHIMLTPMIRHGVESSRFYLEEEVHRTIDLVARDVRAAVSLPETAGEFQRNDSSFLIRHNTLEKDVEAPGRQLIRYKITEEEANERRLLVQRLVYRGDGHDWVLESTYPVSRNLGDISFETLTASGNTPTGVILEVFAEDKYWHHEIQYSVVSSIAMRSEGR